MRIRTFLGVTALAAITIIVILALWRDNLQTTEGGSSEAIRQTAASRPASTLPPAPATGLPRSDEVLQGLGDASEHSAATHGLAALGRPAIEPAPTSTSAPKSTPTQVVPAPPPKSVAEGAVAPPPPDLPALPQMPTQPTRPAPSSATASLSPRAASESGATVARMQLVASMQGLEPGPAISLPIRLSPNSVRTIYFFTELRGLNGRPVIHRWEFNDRVMQERKLLPASQSWRAYTGMAISGGMRGRWRISAIDATTGKVLAQERFTVE